VRGCVLIMLKFGTKQYAVGVLSPAKFNLLTLKFYHEICELQHLQPGVSDTLEHGDMFHLIISSFVL